MGCVIRSFSKIDAGIQRRLDAACFFLMRRFDRPKTAVRSGLYVLVAAGAAMSVAAAVLNGDVKLALMCAAIVLTVLAARRLVRPDDIKILFGSMGASIVLISLPLGLSLERAGWIVLNAAFVLDAYLTKTPERPE